MTLRSEDVAKVLEVWKQLEPGALEGANFTLLDRSALSIAISLKRIADSVAAGPPISDAIYNAISEAIFAAQQRSQ